MECFYVSYKTPAGKKSIKHCDIFSDINSATMALSLILEDKSNGVDAITIKRGVDLTDKTTTTIVEEHLETNGFEKVASDKWVDGDEDRLFEEVTICSKEKNVEIKTYGRFGSTSQKLSYADFIEL